MNNSGLQKHALDCKFCVKQYSLMLGYGQQKFFGQELKWG